MRKILKSFLILPLLVLLTSCGNTETNPDARDEKNPLVREALEQIDAQEFGVALKTLEHALDKNPELARAHLEAARIYHVDPASRDYPSAIYHYRRYLEKRPNTNKAEVIQKWIKQAEVNYADEVMHANPNDFMAEVNRLKRENASLRRQVQQYNAGTDSAPIVVESKTPIEPAKQIVTAPKPQPKPTQKPITRTYTVQSGDTLSKISRKVYGNGSKWKTLYNANRSNMKSERDLKIGQALIIPELNIDAKPRG